MKETIHELWKEGPERWQNENNELKGNKINGDKNGDEHGSEFAALGIQMGGNDDIIEGYQELEHTNQPINSIRNSNLIKV